MTANRSPACASKLLYRPALLPDALVAQHAYFGPSRPDRGMAGAHWGTPSDSVGGEDPPAPLRISHISEVVSGRRENSRDTPGPTRRDRFGPERETLPHDFSAGAHRAARASDRDRARAGLALFRDLVRRTCTGPDAYHADGLSVSGCPIRPRRHYADCSRGGVLRKLPVRIHHAWYLEGHRGPLPRCPLGASPGTGRDPSGPGSLGGGICSHGPASREASPDWGGGHHDDPAVRALAFTRPEGRLWKSMKLRPAEQETTFPMTFSGRGGTNAWPYRCPPDLPRPVGGAIP